MALEIRLATVGDADAIARLLDQLGYPADAGVIPARLDRLANDRSAVFLALRDGVIVGLATVHILTLVNHVRDVGWLTALVVDESARGIGVGRRLVERVEKFAREHDCERLSVTTHERRPGAHAFYARVGFELTGRRFGKVL